MNKLVILISMLICSCEQPGNNPEKQESKNEIHVDEEKDALFEIDFGANSPLGKELEAAMNDSTVDDYFKKILRKGKLVDHTDHNKMFSITDSLFTTDKQKDFFYFLVFTKSMNGSDGIYSEVLGLSALRFVNEQTEKFADFFNVGPNLTDKDMDNWASFIIGEIMISKENHELETIRELELELKENIELSRKEYSLIIGTLIKKIKSKTPEMVK